MKAPLESAYASLLQRGRLEPNHHQAAIVSRLAQLQHELTSTPTTSSNPLSLTSPPSYRPRGLYIYGSVGTGKSRIADLFSTTLPTQISKRRIHFHDFMSDIHSRLHIARSAPKYHGDPLIQIGRTIRSESRVLCFDEFQVTDIADAMILSRLFGSIWREGGVMVSTSNRHPEGLYENGLNRDVVLPFIREIQRRCEVWEIGGSQDYRMRGIGGEGSGERVETFFTDEEGFDWALSRALGSRKLEGVSIPVHWSRSLDVDAAVPKDSTALKNPKFDLISSNFSHLCETSLGSSDYHALCTSTPQIFLSGLRTFRPGEKDSVRRFITLIDLAYENKTRVICQSAVPLSEVFANIVPLEKRAKQKLDERMRVKGEGGSSSSMMSTFIGETEWSATGLVEASLATGGAGETDVGFAIGRAISRLYEMASKAYGEKD